MSRPPKEQISFSLHISSNSINSPKTIAGNSLRTFAEYILRTFAEITQLQKTFWEHSQKLQLQKTFWERLQKLHSCRTHFENICRKYNCRKHLQKLQLQKLQLQKTLSYYIVYYCTYCTALINTPLLYIQTLGRNTAATDAPLNELFNTKPRSRAFRIN